MTLEEANEKYLNKDIIILRAAGLKLDTAIELIGECFKIIKIEFNPTFLQSDDIEVQFKYYLNVQPLCYRYSNLHTENNPQYWLWLNEFELITEIEQQRIDNLKQILI